MRPPSASEIILLARVLTRIVDTDRQGSAMTLLSETDEAERYLRLTGRPHPVFGDGSLMARCHRLKPPSEALADDRDFLICLVIAANAMLSHSRR
jgi:uncharacterized protein YecE (DUF72 family)